MEINSQSLAERLCQWSPQSLTCDDVCPLQTTCPEIHCRNTSHSRDQRGRWALNGVSQEGLAVNATPSSPQVRECHETINQGRGCEKIRFIGHRKKH